jgi:alpha-glucosidase (family GH31 glycosyl hydrolase)
MAAPVIKAVNTRSGLAAQKVWFPAGRWFNFFDGSAFDGGRWHTLKSTLEDIPVFAQAGAIVPLAPKVGWGGLDNPRELDIYIFPGAVNCFELYEDDGETVDYQNGKYAITPFTLENNKFTIHAATGDTSLIPAQRTYRIHIRGVDENMSASLPGKYDSATRTFSLEPFTLAPADTFSVTFK